jgi:ribosome biogenesis GTPase A
MAINWFPGHMATARKMIRKVMPDVDLVIEVLDARIPLSSANPLLTELRGEKPCIQILNKADLADPQLTAAWVAHIESQPGMRALPHYREAAHVQRELVALGRTLVPPHRTVARPMLAMIAGVPNVGKSTLINQLVGRTVAKTGNKPAVTRDQQRARVGSDLILLDTPGFLWPKLSAWRGYRLAVTGAILDRVLEPEDLAYFAIKFLGQRYPTAIADHYEIPDLAADPGEALETIGRKRGFLRKGGVVDIARTAERLLLELRAGAFGRITLETPWVPEEADPPKAGEATAPAGDGEDDEAP